MASKLADTEKKPQNCNFHGAPFLKSSSRPQIWPQKRCNTQNMRIIDEIIHLLGQENPQSNKNQLLWSISLTHRCFLVTHFPKGYFPAFMQKLISLIYGKSYSWEMGDKYDR